MKRGKNERRVKREVKGKERKRREVDRGKREME